MLGFGEIYEDKAETQEFTLCSVAKKMCPMLIASGFYPFAAATFLLVLARSSFLPK